MIQLGSSFEEVYSESCTQVIVLSPEVNAKPSIQSTENAVPFLTGNVESVFKCFAVGNFMQVPAIVLLLFVLAMFYKNNDLRIIMQPLFFRDSKNVSL